jgi:GNAT superfamily N-acetyltransferase
MAATKKLKTKPVDETNWDDFEKLFKLKGSPHYCWCMVWRMTKEEQKRNSTINRKKFIKKRVVSQTPIGLLGYIDNEPVAWCSVAPRETYQRLGGDENLEKVWSIACFFIIKEYREQGLVDQLIAHAQKYARKNGAKYIEAYPVASTSPSYRFMGFTKTFEKAKFKFVKKAGTRRNVMTYKLK